MVDNTLFGGVYYINLKHRTDRNAHIIKELDKMKLKYKRFDAIRDEVGIIGCGKSHLAVLKKAKKKNLKNVLVFEDDFKFIVDKKTFWNEMNTFFKKEIDYDALMLSYNSLESIKFDDQLIKIIDAQTASGYIINQKLYDPLIELWENALPLLEESGNRWHYSNDMVWKQLQPIKNWYAFNNRIGKQMMSYSDLEHKIVDYGV
jgi:glycosyl transferase family 25